MPTTLKQSNMLSPKEVKEAISVAFPSMPRYKKIKLATSIIPAFTQAVEAAEILGKKILTEPFPQNCDLDDDYLILRDEGNQSIADVYVGAEKNLIGHVVFDSGEQLDEHTKWQSRGESEVDGFIHSCSCASCLKARAQSAVDELEPHLINHGAYSLFLPSLSHMKVTGASDRLLEKLQDSQTILDNSTGKPKVVSVRPMTREGNSSRPLE